MIYIGQLHINHFFSFSKHKPLSLGNHHKVGLSMVGKWPWGCLTGPFDIIEIPTVLSGAGEIKVVIFRSFNLL